MGPLKSEQNCCLDYPWFFGDDFFVVSWLANPPDMKSQLTVEDLIVHKQRIILYIYIIYIIILYLYIYYLYIIYT